MKSLTVRLTGPLSLEMAVPGQKTERLFIRDISYPVTTVSETLFSQIGTMHLVAPYLPERIDTDFAIHPGIAKLIDEMYASCGHAAPRMFRSGHYSFAENLFTPISPRIVVAASAGKDSLHNVMLAHERCGQIGTMVAHISGLNRNNASEERKYSRLQAKALDLPYYREVDLLNSSTNSGYATMRSRDLFLAGLLVPIALEFGASRIMTEGFAEAKPNEPFSGQQQTMEKFNGVLRSMNIPVAVTWENRPEMDIIRELYHKRPSWMPHMCNCFQVPYRKPGIQRSWKRRTPSLPLYRSQCGSCVKCRITNVARILYDRDLKRKATLADIAFYLADTAKWTKSRMKPRGKGKRRQGSLADMLEGSYMRDLDRALEGYGLGHLKR